MVSVPPAASRGVSFSQSVVPSRHPRCDEQTGAGMHGANPYRLMPDLDSLDQHTMTNTSVNPARSTGVALFVGGWAVARLRLFWVAPIVGAILGAVVYKYIGGTDEKALSLLTPYHIAPGAVWHWPHRSDGSALNRVFRLPSLRFS